MVYEFFNKKRKRTGVKRLKLAAVIWITLIDHKKIYDNNNNDNNNNSSEEQFLKLTSNWQVTWGEKSIHQKAQQYCDEIAHDIQQLAAMGKLPLKFTIKSARINKLETKLAWAIYKKSWAISCRQRVIKLMAKIFYPKKTYRFNSSCYARTGNLHYIC